MKPRYFIYGYADNHRRSQKHRALYLTAEIIAAHVLFPCLTMLAISALGWERLSLPASILLPYLLCYYYYCRRIKYGRPIRCFLSYSPTFARRVNRFACFFQYHPVGLYLLVVYPVAISFIIAICSIFSIPQHHNRLYIYFLIPQHWLSLVSLLCLCFLLAFTSRRERVFDLY